MAILGTKVLAPTWPGVTIDKDANNQRALVLPAFVPPTAGYVTALGVTVRRSGANAPNAYVALWATDAAGNPTTLLAATAAMSVPSGSGGSVLEGNVPPVRLAAGGRYALGVLIQRANAEIATIPGAATTNHFRRTVASGNTPRDPFGATSIVADGALALYAVWTPNTAPSLTPTAPANGAALTPTPIFAAAFSDAESGLGDGLASYTAQVRIQNAASNLWDATFAASASERSASAIARLYAGPALAADGTVYEWRLQARDDAGEASAWTPWRSFTVNPLGAVDLTAATSPVAKVDTDPAAIAWGGTWSHPTALATNAVQVRVLLGDGTVIRTGATVTQTVANGAAFTIAAGSAGIGALPGGTYQYQIRGRASDGQWSPWSDGRSFKVDSPPTTPSNLQPPSGSSSTSRPLLEWNVLDPDPEDLADLTSEIELTRPNGSVLVITVPNANYDAAAGKFAYQLTATDLPATGSGASWRVRGKDGANPFNGVGQWSRANKFDYVSGPAVSIDAPADGAILATSVPVFQFSLSTGTFVAYRIDLYVNDAPDPFASTGKIDVPAASSGSGQIAAGLLKNGGVYDAVVTLWTNANTKYASLRRQFSVAYPPANPLNNVAASTTRHRRDVEDTSILVTWDETNYPADQFAGYVVRRRYQGEDASAAVVLRTLSAPGQSRFVDYHAPSDVGLVYSVSQLFRSGVDTQESDPADVDAMLDLGAGTLVSVDDPESTRIAFVWLRQDQYGGGSTRPQAKTPTWGSKSKPTLFSKAGEFEQQTFNVTVSLLSDDRGQMLDHFADFRALVRAGAVCCFRSGEGDRAFVTIDDWRFQRIGPWRVGRTVVITLSEVDFTEGET